MTLKNLLPLIIAAIAFTGFQWITRSNADSKTVADKIAAGAVILDVRTPEEFASGAYPKAINIPVQVIDQRLSEIPRDKPIVVYCRSGARSAKAKQVLETAGFADVTNAGGLSDMPKSN